MKILMIGTDRDMLRAGSKAQNRLKGYASLVDMLEVIVYAKSGFQEQRISPNARVQPTNSWGKFLYIIDAYRLGRRLEHIAIVSAQDPFACGIAGWLIAKHLGVKLQIQVHTDFMSPYFSKESFLNKIRVQIARFILIRADCVRVVSERIKRSLIETMRIKESCIFTLPIYTDTVRGISESDVKAVRKKYASASHVLLMASRFTREKNIYMGIRAMQNIVAQYPNARLLLIGSGPEEDNLQRYIAKLHLQEHVLIEPWVDDLLPYYAIADMFILTSYYEGYGRTVVEAALQGVPVVMTDVGVAIGSVVPVGDVAALTARISALLENPEERKRVVCAQESFLALLSNRATYDKLFIQQFTTCL